MIEDGSGREETQDRYTNWSNLQMVHELCSRQPDLYMDVLEITKNLPRRELQLLLRLSDLDRNERRKPRLKLPPPIDPDDFK